jgi:hypothetical protein
MAPHPAIYGTATERQTTKFHGNQPIEREEDDD